MKIKFVGQYEEVLTGVQILSIDMNLSFSEEGMPIYVQKQEKGFSVNVSSTGCSIFYNKNCEFFRAFAIAVEAIKNERDINVTQIPAFDTVGTMMDMSRNAVYKVESTKTFIRKMALMGMNMFMLYTEDTYEIKNQPYFGYMRGRYTDEEIKECVDYADVFGIEVIPCIQTLAHLKEMLKWNCYEEIKDTSNILLANSNKTYEFIEEMIKTVSNNFSSKRIHIGMDEAFGLGTGRFRDLYGEIGTYKIMLNHLERVTEIVEKYGLNPIIWSDMFVSPSSQKHNYWDLDNQIPQQVLNKKSEDVDMVFWCYHLTKKEDYKRLLDIHKQFKGNTWFAGAIETCFGIAPRFGLSELATNAALMACKESGVKEIICTLWGDDGSMVNYTSALLGIQLYAEHCYNSEVTQKQLFDSFKTCTGGNGEDFQTLSLFDELPDKGGWDKDLSNPSKFILWQDVLLGLFDKHLENVDLKEHYSNLAEILAKPAETSDEYKDIFDLYMVQAQFLSIKSEIGINIYNHYQANERQELRKLLDEQLATLIKLAVDMRELHRAQWFKWCKPFGFEVLDIRYGGLLARLDTAKMRLIDYLDGKIERIEELEQQRLIFDRPGKEWGEKYGRYSNYSEMITACVF